MPIPNTKLLIIQLPVAPVRERSEGARSNPGKPVAAAHPPSVACGSRKVHWSPCHRPGSYRSCQLQVLAAIAAYRAELADAQSGVMATLVQLTPQGVAPLSHQIWQ